MAVEAGNKYEFGKFLAVGFEEVIRRQAFDSVQHYFSTKDTNPTQAISDLKRAIDLPHRLRSRFDLWVAQYNTANGAGSATTFMQDCLARFNQGKTGDNVTNLAAVNSRLTAMETWAANVVVQSPAPYGNGTLTWDQVATNLRSQIDYIPTIMSRLPFPEGYVDIWGE